MWTPNSTSPKPSGYLHTRATPGQDGALFGQRRRRAAARVLAAAGSRAPILLRRCSAPAGAQLCRRMRLLGPNRDAVRAKNRPTKGQGGYLGGKGPRRSLSPKGPQGEGEEDEDKEERTLPPHQALTP